GCVCVCVCVGQVVLSKFVRQMGDLLPATLYIPYLRMLKGLANGPQCSHYCFSLLKTNGAPHGTHTHTHTLSLTPPHTLTHTHTHTLSHTHTHTHTHTNNNNTLVT